MFLEKAQAAAGEGESSNWRLFPQEFRDKNEPSCYHHDQVQLLSFLLHWPSLSNNTARHVASPVGKAGAEQPKQQPSLNMLQHAGQERQNSFMERSPAWVGVMAGLWELQKQQAALASRMKHAWTVTASRIGMQAQGWPKTLSKAKVSLEQWPGHTTLQRWL